jgi:hypothetical protein
MIQYFAINLIATLQQIRSPLAKDHVAAKKIDEFQIRTYRGFTLHLRFVIHYSSFVFRLLQQLYGKPCPGNLKCAPFGSNAGS